MQETPIPRGSRVTLRAFTPTDITPAYIAWLNDPQVMRLSNQRFLRHTETTSRAYLASFEGSPNLFLSIRLSASDQAIGTLTAYISDAHGTADMGILVGERSLWGRGFGQDAWDTLSEWLLREKGLRKLTAGTLDCNNGMVRIMERSGMALEAVRRKQEIVDEQPHDMLYYARFRDG